MGLNPQTWGLSKGNPTKSKKHEWVSICRGLRDQGHENKLEVDLREKGTVVVQIQVTAQVFIPIAGERGLAQRITLGEFQRPLIQSSRPITWGERLAK
jgi:hypothetical protein